ncbi:MAG: hypothetical protein GTO02_09355, partial [Candidatus Dadabacteria bacterium]|nr:hypothetical protein [Candidatus Dadabacteria bacterium]
AVRLANHGWNVTGIDIDQNRISNLKNGELYPSEKILQTEFTGSREQGFLKFSTKPTQTESPKVGIICVPTPLPSKNTKSDKFVKKAVEE